MRRTLEERALFAGVSRVLVACSGGPDSQALLHLLHRLAPTFGVALAAAGVDHGLRPEAAEELALARGLAEALHVPFAELRVTVPAGASRQAQARKVRYAALQHCAEGLGAARIAVGHTRDDQAETVLAQLLRGTSIEGLQGIAPRRLDGVVRPLLDCTRADVHGYAQTHALPFARDPSNEDPRYLRVRIRTHLLPTMQDENPRISEQLAALADDAREVSELLESGVQRAKALLEEGNPALREESGYLRRCALRSLVQERTGERIQRTHLVALERMLERGGQVRLPGDHVASLDQNGKLGFSRVPKRGRGVTRPTKGTANNGM